MSVTRATRQIFRDLRNHLPSLTSRMQRLGLPGVFLELEPHLKGGGQFGGFSGRMAWVSRSEPSVRLLDYTEIRLPAAEL